MLVAGAALTHAAADKKHPAAAEAAVDTIPYEAQRRFDYYFFEAQKQQMANNHSAAFELFGHCLDINPNSAQVMYELSSYMRFLKDKEKTVSYLKKAVEMSPDNYWYKSALMQTYVGGNQMDSALTVLNDMARQFPDKSDILMMLIDLYTAKKDYPNVVKTLNALETKEGKSEQLSMEKFRAYVQMKDEKNAFKEMQALAEEYPNDLKYKVLIGDLYLDGGKPEQALKVYKEVEQADSLNPNVTLSLASYYEKMDDDSLSTLQFEKLITNRRIDEDLRYRVMQSLSYRSIKTSEDSTKILRLFSKALSFPQTNTQMAELCARFMVSRNMPPDSVKPVLYKMLEIDPENDLARNQLLSYALAAEDTIGIIKVCQPAVDYSAADPVYYYYLGLAYYQQDRRQEAIDVFTKCLQHAGSETTLLLITNTYSILGDLYHDLGDDDKTFEYYDSCLIYRPDDALVLNNYAYYLSLKKKDLARASEMSLKSLEKDADNPTYLDTYAWILFQQKKYAEAKVQIDRVLELLGDSVTADDANVIEHAGDIYYKSGLRDEAFRLWERAASLGEGSKALEQKAKKHKYAE